jgi:hypothetical protein
VYPEVLDLASPHRALPKAVAFGARILSWLPWLGPSSTEWLPTWADSKALLERRTQADLGMSVDEFLERARRHALPNSPHVPHLLLLAGVDADRD